MDWITVIGCILLGIALIVLEIIFIPGTTIVGIAGILFSGYGVYAGYSTFGTSTGTAVLIGTALASLTSVITAFKGKSWERFSLKSSITAKFNDDFKIPLNVGDRGTSISSLKPMGKALFSGKETEVRSNGGYISENDEVEIIRIAFNKIFVKSVNNQAS